MTQHTPGPWHIGLRTAHSKRDVYGPLGELVALADAVFTDLATAQANARLIAAAPDLLATLKNLIADWERVVGPIPNDHEAKAAITQAEGRG